MPIILYSKERQPYFEFLTDFPNQYVSQKEKESDDWIQHNMDFFSIQAYKQFVYNRDTFVKNYNLVKGILTRDDFYAEPEVVSMMDALKDRELPEHVQNYTITQPVLNTLKGELSKRPDGTRIKAMDDNSQSEELAFRTALLKQLVLQKAQIRLYESLSAQGIDASQISVEEVNRISEEQVAELIDNYTSTAENWGNHVLEAMKMEFNLKEKSEEAFLDLLISGREYYHIVETSANSLGFTTRAENPKNVWKMKTPDKKYSTDWYAGGTIHVMEMAQILEEFPFITKEEIDHLRKSSEQFAPFGSRESNLNLPGTGQNTIKYDTYDALIEREREFMSAYLDEDYSLYQDDIFGLANSRVSFGNKFSVVRAYWRSKIKVGRLTYWDEETQQELVMLVDENYKNNSHPGQIGKVEWSYTNQWYYGVKIGPDVYHVFPYKLLPYMPIIGVEYEARNSPVKSLVDMMKPFQMFFNVGVNQMWKILEKELGMQYETNIRKLLTPKDGDDQDVIENFKEVAKEEGLILVDDSPENTKVPLSNTSVSRALDLSRHNELQSRMQLSEWAKQTCYSLVGMTPERQGAVAATQTATGVNASLTQSYAQTEPYFVQHEYVQNLHYQALIDAAQYVESQKPTSTVSYISGEGEAAFIQVNGPDLKLPELKVYVTSRAKDQEAFQALKNLSQAALQNGASLADVAEIYTTDSIRKVKFIYKKMKEKQDQLIAQQQQMEQQQLQMQQEQFQIQMQQQERARQEEMINENYNKELDRLNGIEKALIAASSKEGSQATQDLDNNGVPDILEITQVANDQINAARTYNVELQKIGEQRAKLTNDRDMALRQLKLEEQKLKQKDREMKSKEKIERIKLRNKVPGEGKTKK